LQRCGSRLCAGRSLKAQPAFWKAARGDGGRTSTPSLWLRDGGGINGEASRFISLDLIKRQPLQTLQQVRPDAMGRHSLPNTEGRTSLSIQGSSSTDQSLKLTDNLGWVMSYSANMIEVSGLMVAHSLGIWRRNVTSSGHSVADDTVNNHLRRIAKVLPSHTSPVDLAAPPAVSTSAVRQLSGDSYRLVRLHRQTVFRAKHRYKGTSEQMATLFGAKQRAHAN